MVRQYTTQYLGRFSMTRTPSRSGTPKQRYACFQGNYVIVILFLLHVLSRSHLQFSLHGSLLFCLRSNYVIVILFLLHVLSRSRLQFHCMVLCCSAYTQQISRNIVYAISFKLPTPGRKFVTLCHV